MKKLLLLLGVLVIALTFGSAYAGSKDMSAGEYNGITVFEPVSAQSHDIYLGSGPVLANGITVFDSRPAESWAEGSAAGGLRDTEPSMELRNGITVF
jgi:hypothetical protein